MYLKCVNVQFISFAFILACLVINPSEGQSQDACGRPLINAAGRIDVAQDAFTNPTPFDQFAVMLQGNYLIGQMMYGGITGDLESEIYNAVYQYVLTPENNATFYDVEYALRRTNSSLHLFAIEAKHNEYANLTEIVPVSGGTTSHFLFISLGGPNNAEANRLKYGVGDDLSNLELLKRVGIRVLKNTP